MGLDLPETVETGRSPQTFNRPARLEGLRFLKNMGPIRALLLAGPEYLHAGKHYGCPPMSVARGHEMPAGPG